MPAWQQLRETPPSDIPRLLSAIDPANPLAANWIRAAAEVVLDRAREQGKFPKQQLEAYYANQRHSARTRRMAYEFLLREDPSLADRWLPAALQDPSLEMRRDAVAVVLNSAQQKLEEENQKQDTQHAASRPLFQQALQSARDLDQVRAAADELRKMGEKVDLIQHFGFVTQWQVIGPFDNKGRKGFDQAYGPETDPRVWKTTPTIEDSITYPGLEGDVKWTPYQSTEEFGNIDFNQAIAKKKEVIGYGRAVVTSSRDQTIQLRLTSVNASKVWLNGKPVMTEPIYHSGSEFDQYVTTITLNQGPNVLLVKLCQNEQTESWTEDWKFQLRLCDELGSPALAAK